MANMGIWATLLQEPFAMKKAGWLQDKGLFSGDPVPLMEYSSTRGLVAQKVWLKQQFKSQFKSNWFLKNHCFLSTLPRKHLQSGLFSTVSGEDHFYFLRHINKIVLMLLHSDRLLVVVFLYIPQFLPLPPISLCCYSLCCFVIALT